MIDSCPSVVNIIAFLKNMSEDEVTSPKDTVDHCVSLLEKIIPELEEQISRKISFLREQLSLAFKKSKEIFCRYSDMGSSLGKHITCSLSTNSKGGYPYTTISEAFEKIDECIQC